MAKRKQPSTAMPQIVAVCRKKSAAARSLAALGKGFDPAHGLTCYADLAAARSAVRRGIILVPVLPPYIAVGLAIEAGAAPSTALARWTADAAADLKAARGTKRVMLVDAAGLETHDADTISMICAGLDQEPPTSSASDASAPKPLQPQSLVLAVAALASDAKAQALATDLTEMLGAPAPLTDDVLDQAARISEEVRLLRAELDQSAPQGGAAEEVALLRDGLAHMLTELEEMDQARSAAEAQVADLGQQAADRHLTVALNGALENQLAELRRDQIRREAVLGHLLLRDAATIRDLNAELTDVTTQQMADLEQSRVQAETALADALKQAQANAASRDMLTQQVAKLQADLKAQAEEQEKALAERDAEIQALHGELDKIYASKSWKVTAPMRGVRRGLGPSDKS